MEKKRFTLARPVIIILEVIAIIAVNVISYIVLKKISDSRKSNTILLGASSPAADQSSVNWSFILPMLIPSVLMVGFTVLLLWSISRMKSVGDRISTVLVVVSSVLIVCSIVFGICLFRYQQRVAAEVPPILTHQAG